MMALSIMQPWAWLIVHGHKDIENRGWQTSRRGPILIHAGLKIDMDAERILRSGRHPVTHEPLALCLPQEFARGGIVGEAEITGCVAAHKSPWFMGEWGFLIRNAKPLPFQPCRGKLGFFEPDIAIQTGAASGQGVLI